MNLEKLYKLQEELDNHILEKHNIKMTKEELLDNTILALLVEVGELANATRCFKHWSTKGPSGKEIILDELADVWHFYLSIGNQKDYRTGLIHDDLDDGAISFMTEKGITGTFLSLYYAADWLMKYDYDRYTGFGYRLQILGNILGFTDEEVEQAYLKKHEENYKRQREGY